MRERSTLDLGPAVTLDRYGYDKDGNETAHYVSSYQDSTSAIMHDVVTEGYHTKSAQGEIINNAMDRTVVQTTNIPGFLSLKLALPDGREWVGPYAPSWLGDYLADPIVDTTDYQEIAITKAWANMSASMASALVSLAEAEKTVLGLISIFRRFQRILKMVKRLQWDRLARELSPNELANRWLEIRYGIRPLVYDAKQIVDALNHSSEKVGTRFTFRGLVLESETDHDQDDSVTFSSHVKYYVERSVSAEVTVRSGVLCRLNNIIKADVWGLLDVPQAVLDLTTFSFVAGWFFNIADFVSSWTPSASYKALASWTVVKKTLIQMNERGLDEFHRDTGAVGGYGGDKKILKTTTYVRIPEPVRPIAPKFNLNLDTFKLIDIVALCKGFFTSIPRMRY